ncbi:MAG: hypothetical protein KC588_14290 [Nitrospira sp.]|nr:hypothetical protein [Nitrospira sp.]
MNGDRYFPSTVIDNDSRYIITWQLTTTMAVSDVTNILKDALDVADLDKTPVHQKPELLFDNGPR